MSAIAAWAPPALLGSAALMLLVLALRAPVRRLFGPGLAYALWALPALRLVLPPLPAELMAPVARAAPMTVLLAGPQAVAGEASAAAWSFGAVLPWLWAAGAVLLFGVVAVRHVLYCRRLRAEGSEIGQAGRARVLATDVEGPLAFGVFSPVIAVPRDFEANGPDERALAVAHEAAHHARGDLLANWASIAVLAAHWWNPVAWVALRAFRDDQEFAADAHVLAGQPGARAVYARLLARAAGFGALPACNLNARSSLKGRLMMISQQPRSARRLAVGGAVLALIGTAALAATGGAPAASGKQAVTIGVKPDGTGGHMLLVGGTAVAPGAALPGGMTLPADFSAADGCNLSRAAKPRAVVIKGTGGTHTYTVMCASAAPAAVRATLEEGMASLRTMRASVASQPASAVFPEAERAHALGAIDASIAEVQAQLAGG